MWGDCFNSGGWGFTPPHDVYNGLMYKSKLGNQICGGCGLTEFQPTFSKWVLPNDYAASNNAKNAMHHYPVSPSLRLTLRLAKANSTVCFVGDSIDFQIYDALRHNLLRQKQLQNQINISISEHRQILVNYTNETGKPPHKNYDVMDYILERVVSLTYNSDDSSSVKTTHSAIFRYFKMYGWSPWDISFMDECNVVILNLGLHYDARTMIGDRWGKTKFNDDFRSAITYLTEFASSGRDRIAIWRSTLPQHFDTFDGHYEHGANCSLKKWKRPNERMIQNYNNATDHEFSAFCGDAKTQCGHRLEHRCTVNRTSLEYRTVYKFLIDNNCTKRLQRFQGNSTVTGNVYRWNIADLFDVASWHSGQEEWKTRDCSHFCYVAPLYEAAFERLELLLSTKTSD